MANSNGVFEFWCEFGINSGEGFHFEEVILAIHNMDYYFYIDNSI